MKQLFLHQKGQAGLEVMLIATAIIILGTAFSTVYFASQDSTIALVIAKNGLAEQLNTLEEPVILSNLRYTLSPANKICIIVETTPAIPGIETLIDTSGIESDISGASSFSGVEFKFPIPLSYVPCTD